MLPSPLKVEDEHVGFINGVWVRKAIFLWVTFLYGRKLFTVYGNTKALQHGILHFLSALLARYDALLLKQCPAYGHILDVLYPRVRRVQDSVSDRYEVTDTSLPALRQIGKHG